MHSVSQETKSRSEANGSTNVAEGGRQDTGKQGIGDQEMSKQDLSSPVGAFPLACFLVAPGGPNASAPGTPPQRNDLATIALGCKRTPLSHPLEALGTSE